MTAAPTLDTSRRRVRRYAPHEQTSANVGAGRLAWVDAQARAAGTDRCTWLLAAWPLDADGGHVIPPTRHPLASLPMPVRAAEVAAKAAGMRKGRPVLTLAGASWRAAAPALLARIAGAGLRLGPVVRAVIDGLAERAA